jgi:hypothetical protein
MEIMFVAHVARMVEIKLISQDKGNTWWDKTWMEV